MNKTCSSCKHYGLEKASTILYEKKHKFLKPVCNYKEKGVWRRKDADDDDSRINYKEK